jgi:thiol-disulfide isomerase/thioredoxin
MRGLNRQYATGWSQIARLVRDEGRSFSGRESHCVFMNTGGIRFAHASSAAGLDYVDDGRASAVVDWDCDGDLDLWVTNRTGPRVRFMQNQTDGAGNFVAFKLTGTSCNRDAVGARLELRLPDDPRPHIRTLHAGEGFLSQSSKWMHFGLGEAAAIEQLTVRWPDGKQETISNLDINRRYRIVQDSGRAELVERDRSGVVLQTAELPNVAPAEKVRVVFAETSKLPDVEVESVDGTVARFSELAEGPLLLNIWQTTCGPCLKELTEFSKAADRFRESGISIVALHASDPKTEPDADRKAIEGMLTRVKFPFPAARTIGNSVERLDKFQDRILQKHRGIVLPTSFLLDGERNVVAVYKGPVTVEQILDDAKLLGMDREERLQACLPFTGQWFHSPLVDEEED